MRFADDTVLLSNDTEELKEILNELLQATQAIDLQRNMLNMKQVKRENVNVSIGRHDVEVPREDNKTWQI